MALTARAKNTTSLSARTKHTTSLTGRLKHIVSYVRSLVTTDSGDRILVGENEDLVLIWTEDQSGYTARTKHTS